MQVKVGIQFSLNSDSSNASDSGGSVNCRSLIWGAKTDGVVHGKL